VYQYSEGEDQKNFWAVATKKVLKKKNNCIFENFENFWPRRVLKKKNLVGRKFYFLKNLFFPKKKILVFCMSGKSPDF
jgi:hypothetical protein